MAPKQGNGVKGLVDSGLSTVPEAYVQPPEERIDKENAIKYDLPPIDLSKLDGHGPDHDEVANQIVTAAETLGFFQVVNHGVPLQLAPSKEGHVSPSPLVKYGTSYIPEKEKALGWKDYILMQYTNDDEALQHWPQEIKHGEKLLQVTLGNLGVKPDDSMIDVLIGKKMLSMIFYPICPNPDLTLGVGRHFDIGTFTVLLEDEVGGLYDTDYGRKGDWIHIPPIPNALVINVGDMLQILSNGKYKSAEHIVCTSSTNSRVSIPIFIMPRETTKIAPLPQVVEKDGIAVYREFVYVDYMNKVFANALDGKKSLDFAKISPA
ncbi:hypothetical protein CXB51_034351 [Gossypium anomalum]|uniref:Fe2OG dioxygenase domain-containing protein n=1 Tax=Gossypium anomalum TaxID=47600 RepID=A0A8J6CLL1_9ROSI|nr:hypothetical protein CXB51_034351 [Gossypium anomalum]